MSEPRLHRGIGLTALVATGICSMLGASINVVPFMIHRSVPDIGPYVLPAFLFAAIPALLAAYAYANLSSAMPKAGGSYIYASRGLSPYLGFIASFSQWFGLSIVIGVIAYIIVPFIRDLAIAISWDLLATYLEKGVVRVGLALMMVWFFTWINILGAKFYERIIIPMMIAMFGLGAIVIIAGLSIGSESFLQEWHASKSMIDPQLLQTDQAFSWTAFFAAGAVLFSSFIGFDAIAQAGGEAKNPNRNLPLAIGLAILIVGGYYILFTASMYHTVPWQLVRQQALDADISAPGLLSIVLSPGLGALILLGATLALLNDLPAMLLSVSRLMFAWSEDLIFPQAISKIHSKYHTPHVALTLSGMMASIGVIGSHYAGDFFLGIDIMVTSMMVNFLLICLTLVSIHWINPKIANQITLVRHQSWRKALGVLGTIILIFFLSIHTWKDMSHETSAWYFHSTPVWLLVMSVASFIYILKSQKLKSSGISIRDHFSQLPEN